jgi:hypothetical protein
MLMKLNNVNLNTLCSSLAFEMSLNALINDGGIQECKTFVNSNFRRVLNVIFFLLGDSPASEFYVPMCQKTECSETLPHKIQMFEESPKRMKQCEGLIVGPTILVVSL